MEVLRPPPWSCTRPPCQWRHAEAEARRWDPLFPGADTGAAAVRWVKARGMEGMDHAAERVAAYAAPSLPDQVWVVVVPVPADYYPASNPARLFLCEAVTAGSGDRCFGDQFGSWSERSAAVYCSPESFPRCWLRARRRPVEQPFRLQPKRSPFALRFVSPWPGQWPRWHAAILRLRGTVPDRSGSGRLALKSLKMNRESPSASWGHASLRVLAKKLSCGNPHYRGRTRQYNGRVLITKRFLGRDCGKLMDRSKRTTELPD